MCEICKLSTNRSALGVIGKESNGIRLDLIKSDQVTIKNGMVTYDVAAAKPINYIRALCQKDGKDYQVGIEIAYCPFCGEKLT